ncbi:hypothetical protein PSN45_004410 [Yamadazyma tenuis]|nr:hypothetical protein PSN45_004410 [Yamadazyma tenuis]
MFENLHKITDSVHINPKFLYFIIIPLINSLGDITNYHNGLKISSELVLGQLIGSNLIICGLIIGLICVIKPVSVRNDKSVLVDLAWLLTVFVIFNWILQDGKITRFENCVMAGVYIAHLVYLFGTNKQADEELIPLNIDEELEDLERQDEINSTAIPFWLELSHFIVHWINQAINIVIPLGQPTSLLYYFTITGVLMYLKFPYAATVAVSALVLLLILGLKLKYDLPFLMNAIGIVNSALIVSNISVVLLRIVKNYGLILKISDYLLGFLVFSIMNSINDIVTNVSLSIKYNSLIGLNACLGTPLLLILIGIGYNALLIGGTLTFTLHQNLMITARGLIALIGCLMVLVPLSSWKFTRAIGFVALGFWFCISILNCVLED